MTMERTPAMNSTSIRQSAFCMTDTAYIEEPILSLDHSYCFEWTAASSIPLLPDNATTVLWNAEDRKLYLLSHKEKAFLVPDIGNRFWGLYIAPFYQCNATEAEWAALMEAVSSGSTFAQRTALCRRTLTRQISIQRRHPLVCYAISQMELTKGKATVESIAEQFGYSTRQLERLFKEEFSYTPKQCNRYIRLLHAVSELLSDPDMSIASKVEDWGYSDASHFQREFKSYVGMTPGQFVVLLHT